MEGKRLLALVVCLVAVGMGGASADGNHMEPQSVTATCGLLSAQVNWAPIQDSHLSGYNVFKRVTGSPDFAQANSGLVSGTTYTVTDLSAGTAYDFGVKAAYDDGHSSVMSALASCTTG